MTDQKISQLADGGPLQPGDLIPVARAGGNYAISGAKLAVTAGHKAWRIRIDHTAGSSDAYCSLAELQFRSVAGTAQGSSGGTAFSTDTGNSATPYEAFDGDPGTRWVGSYPNTGFPKYLGYIYADPISVVEVMIQASGYNTECPTSGGFEYSDDTTTGLDGTWTQAAPFSTTADWTAGEQRVFTALALNAQVNVLASDVTTLQANVATLQTNVAALQANAGTSTGGTGSTGGGTVQIVGSPRAAKFWRVRWLAANGGPTAGIGAVVFASAVGGPQVATGGTGLGSTLNGSGYSYAGPFAGSPSWYSAQGRVSGEWLGYGFTSAVTVAEVRLTPTTEDDGVIDAPRTFAVDFSDDGLGWFQAAIFEFNGWASGTEKAFTLPTIAAASTGGGGSSLPAGYTVPKAADFTAASFANHPTYSLTDSTNGLLISAAPYGNNYTSANFKALPATDWQVAFKVQALISNDAYQGIGVAMQFADTTQAFPFVMTQVRGDYAPFIGAIFSNAGGAGFYSDLPRRSNPYNHSLIRITYTVSTKLLTYDVSSDGVVWMQIGSTTLNADPAMIGPAIFSNVSADAGYVMQGVFTGWKQSF